MKSILFLSTILYFCTISTNGQLIINVKNQGGDVIQESIEANVTENTVLLEFQTSDGTLINQLIDFANSVQIIRALVLGEEERGQSQYQVMCFITHFEKNEFISSDAMSKLRQKNPGTIRVPEDDRGGKNYSMDYFVNIATASAISRHISSFCAEAVNASYTRKQDLLMWARKPGTSELTLMSAVRPFPDDFGALSDNTLSVSSVQSCKNTFPILKVPCQCHFDICIGWYPCGLKYCKGKGNDAKNPASTYRCGIKTCRRKFLFSYYVPQKQLCLWDE
ncbi:out at first protein-like [Chrysoperla carnea]|uniref:out at first protein-like n=1 Tax=Chrysoperla carnea TaxID=189513 RepID=UPI001D08B3DF|nr:out at first protein-like [Chrysoperla carnea]